MQKLIDLTGQTFGRWVVTSRGLDYTYPKSGKSAPRWECLCECGKEKLVHGAHLKNGTSTSCGCYNVEQSSTHGLSHTRAYNAWNGMMGRCSPTAAVKDREIYFDRGIGVCEQWNDVVRFFQDMGECPDGYELERIDGTVGYSPDNCIWANEFTQAQNRSTFKNNTSGKTGVAWSEQHEKWRVGISHNKVRYEGGLYSNFESAVHAREALEIKFLGKIKEN